jgi:hypothetical protein
MQSGERLRLQESHRESQRANAERMRLRKFSKWHQSRCCPFIYKRGRNVCLVETTREAGREMFQQRTLKMLKEAIRQGKKRKSKKISNERNKKKRNKL